MENQNQNPNQNPAETPAETPAPSNHVSADDLKKIRGGIATGAAPGVRSRVEKDDEDKPAWQ